MYVHLQENIEVVQDARVVHRAITNYFPEYSSDLGRCAPSLMPPFLTINSSASNDTSALPIHNTLGDYVCRTKFVCPEQPLMIMPTPSVGTML